VEELNHSFHRTINLAADSAKLAWTLAAVSRYVPRGLYGRIPEWPGSCIREHRRILDALRRGNRHSASGAMRMHITVAGELLLKHLERLGLWDGPAPGKGSRAQR
jgi:DNA-binding GntR family transcriptional regulator